MQINFRTALIAGGSRGLLGCLTRLVGGRVVGNLWLPACKYEVELWLPPGETKGRFIRTGFSTPYYAEKALVYSLVSRPAWKAEMRQRAQAIVKSWHEEAVEAGFGGERMLPVMIKFLPKQDEFAFELSE